MVIDAHAHIFPDPLARLAEETPLAGVARFANRLRRASRRKLAPVRRATHAIAPLLRRLPERIRRKADPWTYLSVLSSLLTEATLEDLLETMDAQRVDRALIIAAPPHAPNEFVLEAARAHPRLVPIVNLPPSETGPRRKLERYATQGAKGLKIHAAMDGEGADSPHYLGLIRKACDLGLPITIHTGCVHMKLVYKDPAMGDAERFEPWFEAFPKAQFVLAHMNLHFPDVAIRLCERHPNVVVDTSWQPAAVISKAVAILGAERVLFGSDWPLVGDNVAVALSRVRESASRMSLSPAQTDLILGANAQRLFGLV